MMKKNIILWHKGMAIAIAASCWLVSCDDSSTSASVGCDESSRPDASCTCNTSTGAWENCESVDPKTCDESSKPDDSCTCNTSTGTWENCESVDPKKCDESSRPDDSCTCNISTGTWENCESIDPKMCDESSKPDDACTCNTSTGTWENCESEDPKTCDESSKPDASCTCDTSTGTWEDCESEDPETCDESSKPDASCTCNTLTGTWENCESVDPKTCDESSKPDASCTCNTSTGTWENCESVDPKTCDESSKPDDSCTCNTSTGTWENCNTEPPGDLLPCDDPANDGQACAYEGNIPVCAKAICQLQICTLVPVDAGKVCRKAAGACDVEEVCDGTSTECPKDLFKPSNTVCRASVWKCDAAEKCTGTSAACPDDANDPNCACPARKEKAIANFPIGSTPYPIDASGFSLKDTNTWDSYAEIMKKTGLPSVSISALEFNKKMVAYSSTNVKMEYKKIYGFKKGWLWASADLNHPCWIPQGIAGGPRDGKNLRIVSWHYDENNYKNDDDPGEKAYEYDKGMRISVVDTTDTSNVPYRNVLLVAPDKEVGFKPIRKHAGGLAWAWPYLYVADAFHGMRVFDMRYFYKVSTNTACKRLSGKQTVDGKTLYCAYGHGYVLPQVSMYKLHDPYNNQTDHPCSHKFSFINLDRIGDTSSILSGEAVTTTNDPETCQFSRIIRWPMGSGGKLKVDANNYVFATEAWYGGTCHLNGGASYVASDGKVYFLLNSTYESGKLYVGRPGKTIGKMKVASAKSNQWGYKPEGIYITTAGNAWISTEGQSHLGRSMYYVGVDALMSKLGF